MAVRDDLPCQDFVELVTAYMEGTLPPDLVARIEAHLDLCDGCRLYLGQMRLTVRALHARGTDRLPPAARDNLHRWFIEWLEGRAAKPPTDSI